MSSLHPSAGISERHAVQDHGAALRRWHHYRLRRLAHIARPIVRLMLGKHLAYVDNYCARKGWEIEPAVIG